MDEKLSLYLKYRPTKFEDMVGNSSMLKSLKSVTNRSKGIPHAFLFCGPSGCGKTTLARILKKGFDCSEQDFVELNVANVRGIETIRDIGRQMTLSPMGGQSRIFLLDESHKLTSDAQHALLKFLEDTPKHVRFILCTTEPDKLISTIRNRCSTFHVTPLTTRDMFKLLKDVCGKEEVELPDEALREIVKVAEGSPRKALVILDSVIDIDDDEDLIEAIKNYHIYGKAGVIDLCRILLNGKAKWKQVADILSKVEEEPENIRYAVLGYMNSVLMKGENNLAAYVIEEFSESFMYNKKAGLTGACYRMVVLKGF